MNANAFKFESQQRQYYQYYPRYIILPWVAVVTEPAEKGLVHPAR